MVQPRLDSTDAPETAASALRALLGTIPTDATAAAGVVAEIVGTAVPASVLRHDDLLWVTVAGDERLCDQSQLAALECDAGPLVERAVTVGDFAVVLAGGHHPEVSREAAPDLELLRQVCVWLHQCASTQAAAADVTALDDEAEVMRNVAHQILSARDLDQVLLSITNQTLRMSSSDICGVFLREGDELFMRSCTGHRVVDTARLRMRRGQGVAGRVFETGEVAKVDSYLHDSTISKDFMSLAEQEATRSALAVPLRLHGDMIGVLEVWRRRYSTFTERDVRRMVALADLATIAIDNGRLYDSQRSTVDELDRLRISLEKQVALLNHSAALQQSLIEIVLDNGAVVGSIAKTLAAELGCSVAIFSAEADLEAAYPRNIDTEPILRMVLKGGALPKRAVALTDDDGTRIWAHPVVAGNNQYGAVCLVGGNESAETMAVACGQAAMACSLTQLQQRAASAARAEAMDQILWDLLDGSPEQRAAARSRAHQMGVRMRGPHRIVYGVFDNIDAVAKQEGWSTSAAEHTRREVLRAIRRDAPMTLTSLRGNWIVGLAAVEDRDDARTLLDALAATGAAGHPDLLMSLGMSTPRDDPGAYATAFNEAKTALAAARRLGTPSLYDELGIVRLLLGSGEDPDFQSFIEEVTGPLLAYDAQSDGSLVKTLRAYFDANCSQKDAADRLYIHPKTLSYRLDRIRQLTNLDLTRHSDRMRADLALRLLDVTETLRDTDTPPGM